MRYKISGYLGILFGIVMLSWIGYNYLIEMLPAAKGKNPIGALVLSGISLYFGVKYLKKSKNQK